MCNISHTPFTKRNLIWYYLLKKRLEAIEIWLCGRMLRTRWKDHVSHEEVSKRIETTKKLLLTTKKRQLNFLDMQEGLGNLTLTGQENPSKLRVT